MSWYSDNEPVSKWYIERTGDGLEEEDPWDQEDMEDFEDEMMEEENLI